MAENKVFVPLNRRQRRKLGITTPMLTPWKRISDGQIAGYVTQDGSPIMRIETTRAERKAFIREENKTLKKLNDMRSIKEAIVNASDLVTPEDAAIRSNTRAKEEET